MSDATALLTEKWQTYLFLTEEMKKFILRNETDMFYSLLEQRETVQNELAETMNRKYGNESEQRLLLQRVQTANRELLHAFQATFNAMKRKEQVMQSYEGGERFIGNYLNQQR